MRAPPLPPCGRLSCLESPVRFRPLLPSGVHANNHFDFCDSSADPSSVPSSGLRHGTRKWQRRSFSSLYHTCSTCRTAATPFVFCNPPPPSRRKTYLKIDGHHHHHQRHHHVGALTYKYNVVHVNFFFSSPLLYVQLLEPHNNRNKKRCLCPGKINGQSSEPMYVVPPVQQRTTTSCLLNVPNLDDKSDRYERGRRL